MLSVSWTQLSSVSNLIGVGNIRKIIIHFFHSLCIAHRVSCPHTHQQNGLAERKHRHIVETGLALLAHAHVPIKFWDDAFLTATYLINRMPTRVIDNTIPLEHLFHTPPNYTLLRVFGCACWPHLRAYNNRKLSFRSKESVFLRYSSLHKDYKCLDRDSGRVYISRDVIFDEQVFPFHRDSKNSGSSHENLRNNNLDDSSVNLGCDHMCFRLPTDPLRAENSQLSSLVGQLPGSSPSSMPIISTDSAPLVSEQDDAAVQTETPPSPSSSPWPSRASRACEDNSSDAASSLPDADLDVQMHADPVQDMVRADGHRYGTRLKNNIHQPKKRTDGTVTYSVVRSSVSEPKSHIIALKYPLWRQAMTDEFRALLKNNTCGILFLLILGSMSLTASGCLKSSRSRMVLLIVIKHTWLLRDSNNNMVLTMMTLSAQL